MARGALYVLRWRCLGEEVRRCDGGDQARTFGTARFNGGDLFSYTGRRYGVQARLSIEKDCVSQGLPASDDEAVLGAGNGAMMVIAVASKPPRQLHR